MARQYGIFKHSFKHRRAEILIGKNNKIWFDFAHEIGASGILRGRSYEQPRAIVFKDDKGNFTSPKGWLKPVKHGATMPFKTNKIMLQKISALPETVKVDQIISQTFNLPLEIRGENFGCSFGSNFWLEIFTISWTSLETPVIVGMPDYQKIIANEKNGENRKTNLDDFKGIPDGFVEVSEEQVEYWFAENKLKNQKTALAEQNAIAA